MLVKIAKNKALQKHHQLQFIDLILQISCDQFKLLYLYYIRGPYSNI